MRNVFLYLYPIEEYSKVFYLGNDYYDEIAEAREDHLFTPFNSIDFSNYGIFITEEASVNMEEVLIGAEETTARIDNIVKNLQAEMQSIEQVQESITVVAGVVDNNSAISQETAAISEEQKSQAESLVNLLNKFRI